MNGQSCIAYVVKRMASRYFSDGISRAAAELSYFLLFSIFPLLMFLNSVLTWLNISLENINPILITLPESIRMLIVSYLDYIADLPTVSPMIVGIVLTLYFVSRAVRSMMRTVNNIYHIEIRRAPLSDISISLGITAGFLVSLIGSFILVVAGKALLRILPNYLPIPLGALSQTHDLGFLLMLAIIFVFLLLFNRVVPNRNLRFAEVWPGALFSLVAWILISWAFSFYVDNLASYSVLYGSLAAIIVLMLWLYIVSMILLMGPQLNHTIMIMKVYRRETGLDRSSS